MSRMSRKNAGCIDCFDGATEGDEGVTLCRLHAAAQTMLDALEAISRGLTNGQKQRGETFQTIARAAIAAARGQR